MILSLLFACKAPPEAPEELNELSRYLYREWGNEDPEVTAAGLENLRGFLNTLDLEGNINDRSFVVEAPSRDDLAAVDIPEGQNPADVLGVSIARTSPWSMKDHAKWQIQVDQLPGEPSAKDYVRKFPEVDDPQCFVDRSCEILVTENDVTRKNLLIEVEFILYKDFRWIPIDDGEKNAFLSRSWTDKVWPGSNENKKILQSYSLDVWIPKGNEVLRYQLLWSDSEVGLSVGDDTVVATLKNATDNTVEAADDAIEELFHSR